MLQNLPVHFDDPEFRADALRGTAKTVAHIDHLIGKLTSLRHDLKIKLAPANLNDAVTDAISALEQGSGVQLIKTLETLPNVALDREQMAKVITNLVLNAVEASPKHTPIHIGTRQSNGSAVVSVKDGGCGMTLDFINESLFKPFQTTKKGGLGIGMFQSKLIVEAHSGRISVNSAPDKGTTFEVSLPVSKS
jgi:signal transduction histidine kinase